MHKVWEKKPSGISELYCRNMLQSLAKIRLLPYAIFSGNQLYDHFKRLLMKLVKYLHFTHGPDRKDKKDLESKLKHCQTRVVALPYQGHGCMFVEVLWYECDIELCSKVLSCVMTLLRM